MVSGPASTYSSSVGCPICVGWTLYHWDPCPPPSLKPYMRPAQNISSFPRQPEGLPQNTPLSLTSDLFHSFLELSRESPKSLPDLEHLCVMLLLPAPPHRYSPSFGLTNLRFYLSPPHTRQHRSICPQLRLTEPQLESHS